jgi:hypothetical protein
MKMMGCYQVRCLNKKVDKRITHIVGHLVGTRPACKCSVYFILTSQKFSELDVTLLVSHCRDGETTAWKVVITCPCSFRKKVVQLDLANVPFSDSKVHFLLSTVRCILEELLPEQNG